MGLIRGGGLFEVGAYSRGLIEVFTKLHTKLNVKTPFLHNMTKTVYIHTLVFINVFVITWDGGLFERRGIITTRSYSIGAYSRRPIQVNTVFVST